MSFGVHAAPTTQAKARALSAAAQVVETDVDTLAASLVTSLFSGAHLGSAEW
jgi:hypothetical protein